MKSLSKYNDTAIDNPNTEPILLFKIEFDGLTLYLCDRVWGDAGIECVFDSVLYQPIILSWDTVQCGKINPVTYGVEPSDTQFVINNNIPIGGADKFTSLFSTYDPHYVAITISVIFKGTVSAADKIDLFKGQIEDLLNMSTDQVTIVCSGYELDIANKFSHEIVDATTFSNAEPDDIGKMLPQVYGSTKRVPFMGIDVGALSTLAEDITSTTVTIKLTDATNFPTSETILIDNEKIAFTGKTGDSLTGCTRASSSTNAVEHKQGAIIGEVQTNYVYALGQPVKAINDVYVADVKIESGNYTAYTGQSGDEHGTYTGRACIDFTSLPRIQQGSSENVFDLYREATTVPLGYAKQLDRNGGLLNYDESTTITFQTAPSGTLSNIYVEYEFEFRTFGTPTDNAVFTLDGVVVAEWKDGESSLTELVASPLRVEKSSWPTSATKTMSWRSVDSDGNYAGVAFTVLTAKVYATSTIDDKGQRGKALSRIATNSPVGDFLTDTTIDSGTSIAWDAAPDGTLSDIEITYKWKLEKRGDHIFTGTPQHLSIDGVNVAWIDIDGTVTLLLPATFTFLESSWQTSITKSASRQYEFRRGYAFVIESAFQACFTDDFNYDIDISGGDSIANAVLGGRISADIDGYQDDGSGTYTGTPSALIEQPDHILKHILVDRCGLTSSEYDSTTYDAAGVYYAANSYTLAFALLQRPNVRTLINRIAKQSKSIEFWEAGVHHLVHIPASETIDKTLDENRIDLNQIWVRYTNRIDIKNTLSARYARDWSGFSDDIAADRAVVIATASGSVTKYGTLTGDQISLAYITGETMAQVILNWIRDDWDEPRLIIEFAGGYYLTDVERGDVIKLSLGTDAETIYFDANGITWEDVAQIDWHSTLVESKLQAATLDIITNANEWRVIDKIYRPDAAQQLQLLQI